MRMLVIGQATFIPKKSIQRQHIYKDEKKTNKIYICMSADFCST